MGSGDEPTTVQLALAQEVHVRARVDLAQHPVDVERIGAEVEVEALGQHHLEDVAGGDVVLGHRHGALYMAGASVAADVGQRLASRSAMATAASSRGRTRSSASSLQPIAAPPS